MASRTTVMTYPIRHFDPPRPSSGKRSPRMTISTHHVALGDFSCYTFPRKSVSQHACDTVLFAFYVTVVEFQHHRIVFAAIHTRMTQ